MAPLPADQRASAKDKFDAILEHYRADGDMHQGYNHCKLLKYTYQYARSGLSQDNFLRAFFQSAGLDIADRGDVDFDDKLGEEVKQFAEMLIDCFFIPLKATGGKTPQPTPAHLSAIQSPQGNHDFLGVEERLPALRALCLSRDKNRCVISGKFDGNAYFARQKSSGGNPMDDEGNPIDRYDFDLLQVAHILPHFLAQVNDHGQLDEHKKAVLSILNMFDTDAAWIFGGSNIDRPNNALTMTAIMHNFFGAFKIYFDPVPNKDHTYCIKSFLDGFGPFPTTRTIYTGNQEVEPPSPRLLALHSAIGHILHLSGAGEYIDKILRDLENTAVQGDGSTELDRLVRLRLGGWLDGVVEAY